MIAFISIYVIFSYMFMSGVAAEMANDKMIFKLTVRILAPFYVPYVIAVCLMGAQRVNKRIISRMKEREKKRIAQDNKKVNDLFLKDLAEMSKAMTEAAKPSDHFFNSNPFNRK